MKQTVSQILCHPLTKEQDFESTGEALIFPSGQKVRRVEGIPVFHEDKNVGAVDRIHRSHAIPGHLQNFFNNPGRLVLHLGSGAREPFGDHVVDVDYSIYPNTDVGVDAHHLPFVDGCFDDVVSLNVFEHLRDPRQAVSEIRRVLKPQGRAVIQTAFLQPLHASPSHFFNVTEAGLREWFRDFQVESVTVPDNFLPAVSLAWISCMSLHHMREVLSEEEFRSLSRTTLGEWSGVWVGLSSGELNPQQQKLLTLFRRMHESGRKEIAAGFEIVATKSAV